MRAAHLKEDNWKWKLAMMVGIKNVRSLRTYSHRIKLSNLSNVSSAVGNVNKWSIFFWLQSKNVAKKRYIVKEKRAQLEQLRASNAQLKQQHDERYRSMLKHFSVEQLNHLLSYSMDELKAMPVDVSSPTGESFEPYVNLNLQTIDEFCIEVTK